MNYDSSILFKLFFRDKKRVYENNVFLKISSHNLHLTKISEYH